jgi:pimeloyl-ACP methyl ester carboxylesterase
VTLPFFTSNQTEIYFETLGDHGPWVTLINGHTRSSSDFKMFRRYLVDAGFQVLIFDNRGAGQTRENQAFTMLQMVEDVENLWHYHSIEKTHLVGISMGGAIAQQLAARHPDVVEKLCLVSTYYRFEQLGLANDSWGQNLEDAKGKLIKYFSPKFVQDNAMIISAMAKQIYQQIQDGQFLERAERQKLAMSANNMVPIDLLSCHVDTLILHGELDQIIEIKVAIDDLAKLPKSRLKIYEGAGHLLLAEKPREMYQDIIQFFSEP